MWVFWSVTSALSLRLLCRFSWPSPLWTRWRTGKRWLRWVLFFFEIENVAEIVCCCITHLFRPDVTLFNFVGLCGDVAHFRNLLPAVISPLQEPSSSNECRGDFNFQVHALQICSPLHMLRKSARYYIRFFLCDYRNKNSELEIEVSWAGFESIFLRGLQGMIMKQYWGFKKGENGDKANFC